MIHLVGKAATAMTSSSDNLGILSMRCSAGLSVLVQEPEELFETLAQCLLSGVDRDALSGWGGIAYIM